MLAWWRMRYGDGSLGGQRLDLIVLKLFIIMFSNIYVQSLKIKDSYAEQLVLFEIEFEF